MEKWFRQGLVVSFALGMSWVAAQNSALAGYYTLTSIPGVSVIGDDSNQWQGTIGTAITHQRLSSYWIKKTLDIPVGGLSGVQEARVRVFFCLHDNAQPENGLTEQFEIVVNSSAPHVYSTGGLYPSRPAGQILEQKHFGWQDFVIPVGELQEGINTITIRKVSSATNDDVIYVGIDNTTAQGHSAYSTNSGVNWSTSTINTIGAKGEYMVRLVLTQTASAASTYARWEIPANVVLDPSSSGAIGARFSDATSHKVELDPRRMDVFSDVHVQVSYTGATVPTLVVRDEAGQNISYQVINTTGTLNVRLAAGKRPYAITASPAANIQVIHVRFFRSRNPDDYYAQNLTPVLSATAGAPLARTPAASVNLQGFTIENPLLKAVFDTQSGLSLVSLTNELLGAGTNVVRHADLSKIFLVELDTPTGVARYGAGDFQVTSVNPLIGQVGVEVTLQLTSPLRLQAVLKIESDGDNRLRFSLALSNVSGAPLTWKTAFPHFAGLALSSNEVDDYYFFPFGGGAISDANVYIRTTYGDQSAWWQMIDLFSPARGAGLSLSIDDATGLFKSFVLRKGVTGVAGASRTAIRGSLEPGMTWESSVDQLPGLAMTVEYVKRTRANSGTFAPPDAILEVHAGGWKNAMQTYADWAHDVWTWQAPSMLSDTWGIQTVGWGQSPLYANGAYRTNYVTQYLSRVEAAELASWWEWSTQGPWQTSIANRTSALGAAFSARYAAYFCVDPADGVLKWNANLGDFDYNSGWGGLWAFQDHIDYMRNQGMLSILYIDPVRACATSDLGSTFGTTFGVMNPVWDDAYDCPAAPAGYVSEFGTYNMSVDTTWYQDYLKATMKRIVEDTGVDGIRLDEFGFAGYADMSTQHSYVFAEPRHNAWLQATTRCCEKVREGLDEVDPAIILMTEYPGYDHMARVLDGSLTYDSSSTLPVVRPVPSNLFRFYFPECKVFDYPRLANGEMLNFWNAVGSYAVLYSVEHHDILINYSEVFNGPAEPLVDTLKKGVYANRFTSPDGTQEIVTIYNSNTYTVSGRIMASASTSSYSLRNLPGLTSVSIDSSSSPSAMVLTIPPKSVICVGRVP